MEKLQEQIIEVQLVEHEAAFTMEDADREKSMRIERLC